MCERCGDELRDCAEEEANRGTPYVEAGDTKDGTVVDIITKEK